MKLVRGVGGALSRHPEVGFWFFCFKVCLEGVIRDQHLCREFGL